MINHPGVGEWEQQVWAHTARVGPHVGALIIQKVLPAFGAGTISIMQKVVTGM